MATLKTRQRKLACGRCGYTVRVTRKWIQVGLPTCPCGETLTPDELEDQMFAPGELGREAYARLEVERIEHDIRSERSRSGEWKRRRCANQTCRKYIPKIGPRYCAACGGDHLDPLAHVRARTCDEIPF